MCCWRGKLDWGKRSNVNQADVLYWTVEYRISKRVPPRMEPATPHKSGGVVSDSTPRVYPHRLALETEPNLKAFFPSIALYQVGSGAEQKCITSWAILESAALSSSGENRGTLIWEDVRLISNKEVGSGAKAIDWAVVFLVAQVFVLPQHIWVFLLWFLAKACSRLCGLSSIVRWYSRY